MHAQLGSSFQRAASLTGIEAGRQVEKVVDVTQHKHVGIQVNQPAAPGHPHRDVWEELKTT
jgi:hypothetical protein